MQGICLLFRKVFDIDQYDFGLVLLSSYTPYTYVLILKYKENIKKIK